MAHTGAHFRANSSAVEHCLHTAGVPGSKPGSPTLSGFFLKAVVVVALLTACHTKSSSALFEVQQPLPLAGYLPTPQGWRTEQIALPPDFAPTLPRSGLLELRFMPGMFQPDTDDFWSYAFVWWIDGEGPANAQALNADLQTYFRGLYQFDKAFDVEKTIVQSLLIADGAIDGFYRGTIDGYDPFRTHAPIQLHGEVQVVSCGPKRTAMLFAFSPKPPRHAVWTQIRSVVSGAKCP